jgi:predicted metalloendopeptidase
MNRKKKQQQQENYTTCWIITILFLLAILVIVIITLTYPYPNVYYYRNSQLIHGETRGRTNCTLGEVYDTKLDICGPLLQAFIPEIMDHGVQSCDSFFHHMSGKWISEHHNENRAFTYIYRKNQKHIHDIIRDPTSGPVYMFYRSCLDTIVYKQHQLLDKQQYNHVYEHIMGSFKTHADLPVIFARLSSYGFGAPFLVTIEPHPTEFKMVPLLRSDYPTNYSLVNLPDYPETMVYDLQKCIETLNQWSTDDNLFQGSFIDYLKSERYTSDMTDMGALLDASKQNFWKLYFRELNGYAMEKDLDENVNQKIWILDKHFILNLVHNVESISMRQWKAYIEYSIMYHNRKYVPDLPDDSYFRFHNPVKKMARFRHRMLRNDYPTEETCMTVTHKLMPGIIGNIYLHKFMKNYQLTQQRVTKVVENVRNAFIYMIHDTLWLSQETKTMIKEKLEAIIVRVVHPNYYEEEAFADRLTMDSYLRNLNIIRRYFATRNFELWTKNNPNRDLIQRFGSPITTANAFYSPVTNTITIFGGILKEPIYDNRYDDLDLYATIGMISAHELAHGLDNTGRLFDKDGSFCINEPWKEEEAKTFGERVLHLMQEYDAPYGCINAKYGEQTIGEDLADLNGIKAALLAYKNEGGTDYERFFQIFAQMWAETYDMDIYCERVDNDVHAIASYRVDKTLRQLKEFRETFGCKKGDKMVNENAVTIYGN